jgi:hypothetical protein
MKNIVELFDLICSLKIPAQGQYSLLQYNNNKQKIYYGIDRHGYAVFAIESENPNYRTTTQRTRKLEFWYNAKCELTLNGEDIRKTLSVITCISEDKKEILAFIRLSIAFVGNVSSDSPKQLFEFFTSLTNMFAGKQKANQRELQGFYGELYAIKYFHDNGVDLSTYWQKKERLKFDFSITQQKRIEVKTTTKDVRIHHFLHEQLLSDLYDICIISLLLRIDDAGYSLANLISDVRQIAANNFDTLIYIENFIKNFSDNELDAVKYDANYIERNIKVYRAEDVPRFQDEQPNGVSKTEYDSDLTNSYTISTSDLIQWIMA